VVREEALKGGDVGSQATIASLDDFEKKMKDQGVAVNDVDLTPFKEATRVVYDKLGYADLRREVEKVLAG